MQKLLLIDTFNFLHRAYHALPKTFTDPDGEPINAVYGVTSMLISTFDLVRPTYVIAAMDSIEPTFRVEGFTAYKAHRKPMENDLSSQISKVEEILDAFGVTTVAVPGYEADDVIGTLTEKHKNAMEIIIVSNDRDLWQLADKNVIFMAPSNSSKKTDWISEKEAQARLGFDPHLLPDYKGFRGDPSDNIPGVYGIGDKTAQTLLEKYHSLENVYAHIEEVLPVTVKKKLAENYELAVKSKELGHIILDTPFSLKIEDCRYKEVNKLKVKQVLEKYNFKSLIKRLGFETGDKAARPKSGAKSIPDDNQLQLL